MAMMLPRRQSMGEAIGSGLGTGLGSGLQALANMKLGQMQKDEQARQLMPFFASKGFSPEESRSLAFSPPQVQTEALKGVRLRGAFPQNEGVPSKLTEGISSEGGVSSQRGQPSQQYSPAQQKLLQDAQRMAEATGDPRPYQQAQLEIAKMSDRERLAEQKITAQKFSKNKEFNQKFKSKVFDKEDEALGKGARFRKMQQLSESGDIDNPAYTKLLKKTGLDFLLKKGTVVYDKLVADTAREYASKTKGRISEMIFKEFLKSLPSLETSLEARKTVESVLSDLNDIDIERGKLTRNIIKEKGNIDSYDLEDSVTDRMTDVYKNLENKLLQGTEENRSQSNFFETLPSASEHKGAEAIDHNTGKTLVSNGVEWKEK